MRIMTLYTKIKHYYMYYSHTILLLLVAIFAYLIYGIVSSTTWISIGLQIIYPYSGQIAPTTWQLLLSSWWILWTNNPNVTISISAEQASVYNLYRNEHSLVLTGESFTHHYNHEHSVIIPDELQTYTYQSHFISSTSWIVYSNIINLQLDTTPPSAPIITTPINNTIITIAGLSLSRTSSSDQGIGLEKYRVYFSLVPIFSGSTSIELNEPHLTLDTNMLPQWTVFWYVEAIDYLGNTSSSNIHFFHINNSSTFSSSSSWGWRTIPFKEQPITNNSSWSTTSWIISHGDDTTPSTNSWTLSQIQESVNKKVEYNKSEWREKDLNNLKNNLLAYYDEYRKLCMSNYGMCVIIPDEKYNETAWYHNIAPDSAIFYDIITYHNSKDSILPTLWYTMIYFTWWGIIILYFLQTSYWSKIITIIYKKLYYLYTKIKKVLKYLTNKKIRII